MFDNQLHIKRVRAAYGFLRESLIYAAAHGEDVIGLLDFLRRATSANRGALATGKQGRLRTPYGRKLQNTSRGTV